MELKSSSLTTEETGDVRASAPKEKQNKKVERKTPIEENESAIVKQKGSTSNPLLLWEKQQN